MSINLTTIKQFDIDLHKMEKNLQGIQAKNVFEFAIKKAFREIEAGFEKIIRALRTGQWLSTQEYAFKELKNKFEILSKIYNQSPEVNKDINKNLEEQLNLMLKVCLLVRRKLKSLDESNNQLKHPYAITEVSVKTIEDEIKDLLEKCHEKDITPLKPKDKTIGTQDENLQAQNKKKKVTFADNVSYVEPEVDEKIISDFKNDKPLPANPSESEVSELEDDMSNQESVEAMQATQAQSSKNLEESFLEAQKTPLPDAGLIDFDLIEENFEGFNSLKNDLTKLSIRRNKNTFKTTLKEFSSLLRYEDNWKGNQEKASIKKAKDYIETFKLLSPDFYIKKGLKAKMKSRLQKVKNKIHKIKI